MRYLVPIAMVVAMVVFAHMTAAQAPLFSVQGPITPGDCVVWINSTTIGDSGAPCPPPACTGVIDLSSGCIIAGVGP